MSILWNYLLKQYFKVFVLAIFTFIAILVVSRLETIAHFATLGAPWSTIALFTLYQIPSVLPIAIPLSSLLSVMLLFIAMSRAHELTCLRASGYSLATILAPILCAATLLFSVTFYLTSEVVTSAHVKSRKMVHDFGSVNPLILLQNARIAKLQGAYVAMEPVKVGEEAKAVIIAGRVKERLLLYMIEKLRLKSGELEASTISLLSEHDNRLVIENVERVHTRASDFAFLLHPKGWKVANDHLNFGLLRARKAYLQKLGGPKMRKNLVKNKSEVVRRFSVSFAAFTFTLMGAILGMEISRRESRFSIVSAALLSAIALLCFFIAHELDHLFWISLLLLTLPHLLILSATGWAFFKLQRGIE